MTFSTSMIASIQFLTPNFATTQHRNHRRPLHFKLNREASAFSSILCSSSKIRYLAHTHNLPAATGEVDRTYGSNIDIDNCTSKDSSCCIQMEKGWINRLVVLLLSCCCYCTYFVFVGMSQTAFAAETSTALISNGNNAAAAATSNGFGEMMVKRMGEPKFIQVLRVFKDQGLILAALLGLSAFFSMTETSSTTLWPWKVRELAEKEPENGVFRMLRSDVTRFLTTILIGTTVLNIAATALVTEAATTIFGEAGVSAVTGVMTVRPVAWLSVVLYPVGRVVTFLSMGMLKMLGLKGRSEPYVTEDELKLMLRGAELSGAIEEEEQDMIENVLEIKDTHVREAMTPLVDVVAIDASATLIDFQNSWETHQYSRVSVFEERVDNIVGIAYAMDMLEYVGKVDKLKESTVREIAQPTYFVPGFKVMEKFKSLINGKG